MTVDARGLWLACCAVLDAAGRADLADRLMTHYPQPEEDNHLHLDIPRWNFSTKALPRVHA